MSYDLVIKNGVVIDGSGMPRYRGDVGVIGGRIAAIDGAAPKRVTIQVFDSFDQAKDYRNGPAWKAILDLQKKAAKSRSFVVEGL